VPMIAARADRRAAGARAGIQRRPMPTDAARADRRPPIAEPGSTDRAARAAIQRRPMSTGAPAYRVNSPRPAIVAAAPRAEAGGPAETERRPCFRQTIQQYFLSF
jgi:hypothetical protein